MRKKGVRKGKVERGGPVAERVYVDRIEEGRAVLLFGKEGEEKGTIPARYLPAGLREGAALDLTLTPAPDDTTRQEVKGLMEDLFSDTQS